MTFARGRVVFVLAALAVTALLVASSAIAGGAVLEAKLKGSNEPGGGDPDGSGAAVAELKVRKGKLCWGLEWKKIDKPTAAHIHHGKKGVDGPVEITLFEGEKTGKSAEGCAKGIEKKLLKKIKEHPRAHYVNVHNGEFPGGAIRGQLILPA